MLIDMAVTAYAGADPSRAHWSAHTACPVEAATHQSAGGDPWSLAVDEHAALLRDRLMAPRRAISSNGPRKHRSDRQHPPVTIWPGRTGSAAPSRSDAGAAMFLFGLESEFPQGYRNVRDAPNWSFPIDQTRSYNHGIVEDRISGCKRRRFRR
jgi:hypothetical protein